MIGVVEVFDPCWCPSLIDFGDAFGNWANLEKQVAIQKKI